jgi:hypothetical protein
MLVAPPQSPERRSQTSPPFPSGKLGVTIELGVRRNQLYKWKEQLAGKGETAFRSSGRKPAQQEGEVARLKRELAKVTEERDIRAVR